MLPTWEWGSRSHRETWERRGRRIEIIKSAEWNDRMNRNPRRALSDFDCRVLSGPLAGPSTRGQSRHLNLHQFLDLVHLRPLLLTNFLLLFQGYRRSFSDRRGRHHDLSIPTPITIIIVIAGTGAMFRPPVRSSALLSTRHGTVRIQRSIVNVASTWIHLDHKVLAQSRPSPHATSHALDQASVASCPLQTSSLSATFPIPHPPPLPTPLCVAPPTRMQSDLSPERQDKRRHCRRQQHRCITCC